MQNIVVIGAGQAGSALTAKLRALGYEGELTLIGAEPEPPYQRPPLSKAYLLGKLEKERLYLRPRAFYDDQRITLLTGSEVTEIDSAAQVIHVAGRDIAYDALALTTGSRPKTLPAAIGGDLDGIFTMRSMADADAVAQAGAFAVVLEKVPQTLADEITARVPIPTIGIGASAGCDGQILVVDDMLGLFTAFKAKFVKRYAHLGDDGAAAIAAYAAEVRARSFPAAEHVFADEAPSK